jgi:hypothetical protein
MLGVWCGMTRVMPNGKVSVTVLQVGGLVAVVRW